MSECCISLARARKFDIHERHLVRNLIFPFTYFSIIVTKTTNHMSRVNVYRDHGIGVQLSSDRHVQSSVV